MYEDENYYVSSIVSRKFDKLQDNVRNELLVKLADNKRSARSVAYDVANNFDKLPENVRNELLLKLGDNKDAAYNVAEAISDNFDKLPPNVQNLLFKLADNKDAAGVITWYIYRLPENVRNELQKRLAKHGMT